jgi:hypothetical protein
MAAAAPRREETWLPVERDRALAIRLGPAEARGKLEGADDAPVHADSQDMRVEQKVVGPAQQQASRQGMMCAAWNPAFSDRPQNAQRCRYASKRVRRNVPGDSSVVDPTPDSS